MIELSANISINSKQSTETPFLVKVTFTNKGNADVYVLTYYTPLEGIYSNCFDVFRDGKIVPYDGPIAKRAAPTQDEYIRIPAGKSITVDVDLSSAYQVSVLGK